MHQSREAHHPARPNHSPEGARTWLDAVAWDRWAPWQGSNLQPPDGFLELKPIDALALPACWVICFNAPRPAAW
jgi:hypothetical protein